jgi:RND family efflux transporter MFP subunit
MIRFRHSIGLKPFNHGGFADNAGPSPMHRHTLAPLLALCLLLPACQNKDAAPGAESSAPASGESKPAADAKASSARGNRPQVVTTTLSRLENVPILLEVQGNALALDEVDIRPQKSGMITAIHFKEGDDIHRGQLLFTLDARDDNANVGKSEAAVASAEVALNIAQRDFKRSQDLSDKNFITPSALDTARSKVDTAAAALNQSKAALEQAKVGQSYTRITAPFEGRAGVINVRAGSLVTSTSTAGALVRLTRMNPIGVSFTLPERDLPGLLDALRKGPVKLSAQTTAEEKISGEVVFVDNNVDRSSGTVLVKGKLDNSQRRVWPGQYIAVKLEAGTLTGATVLPAQAVLNNASGRIVYVVQDDGTVESRPVELLRISNEKAVIKGLPAGLKIVVEGGQNLRPGGKISEAKGGKSEGRGKSGDKAASPPAADAPSKEGKAKPARDASSAGKPAVQQAAGVKLPEGFTPRDPERWANASDEQKLEIISRWRERQAAKAAAQ